QRASARQRQRRSALFRARARRSHHQGPQECRPSPRGRQTDGDPFVDAQDWQIAEFDIDVAETAAGKAKATVKFVNLDQPITIVLDLVKIGKDWRIGEITSLR